MGSGGALFGQGTSPSLQAHTLHAPGGGGSSIFGLPLGFFSVFPSHTKALWEN